MSRDTEKGKNLSPEGSPIWEYIATAICATGMANLGMAAGWTVPSLPELMSSDSRIPASAEEISTLASMGAIGGLPAPVLSLLIVDKIGKRKTMLLTSVLFSISWLLILIAKNMNILLLARSISGCSVGLIMLVTPLYMGETLSSNLRGSLMPAALTAFNVGLFFMVSIGAYFEYQIRAGICLIIAIFSAISFYFIPESPYFLMKVQRIEEAKKTLIKLRGKNNVDDEIELIKATLNEKGKTLLKSNKLSNNDNDENEDHDDDNDKRKKENIFKKIFLIRGNLKSFIIILLITFLLNSSGLGIFLSYFGIIFKDMGANIDIKKASMTFGTLQIVSGIASFIIMDKFKRRTLFLTGGLSVSFLLGLIGIYFFLIEYMSMDIRKYFIIPYLSVFIYLIALDIGILSLCSVLASEILAPDVKVPISCITGILNSTLNFIFTKFYLVIAISWGMGHSIPLISNALLTLICVISIMCLLPETKDKTLLDIQKALND